MLPSWPFAGPRSGGSVGLGRRASALGLPVALGLLAGASSGSEGAAAAVPSAPSAGPTFRTLRAPPEIPVATAVILLRTTQEAALDWGGGFSKPGFYQTSFNKKRRASFDAFKSRYANYDLTGLYDETSLQSKDPRTNRFYFAFLNEIQWRTLADGIRRREDQDRFSRVVGDRLYRKILKGDVVGPRISQGDEFDPNAPVNMSSPFSGTWPAIEPPLPRGASPGELAEGAGRLLEYLRGQGYCADFSLSEFRQSSAGKVEFTSFIREPANIEATSSILRQGSDFLPRFEQRILQAFFAERGYESSIADKLADSLTSEASSKTVSPLLRGVRTTWALTPDPDAGL